MIDHSIDDDLGAALTEGKIDLDGLPGMAYYSSPEYAEEQRIKKTIERGEHPFFDENNQIRPEIFLDPEARIFVDF